MSFDFSRIGHRTICVFAAVVVAGIYLVTVIAGEAQDRQGWKLEREADHPSYAFISPATTDVDIDTIVLNCSDVGRSSVLQLELYPSGALPLVPAGANVSDLRSDPRLQIWIDGRVYPVSMFVAEDHIVVADTAFGRAPAVSQAL